MVNLPRQLKRTITQHQPSWVCQHCGKKYGQKPREGVSTWHYGECNVCHNHASVTEPRDFGYLKQGWQSQSSLNAQADVSRETMAAFPKNPVPFIDTIAEKEARIKELEKKVEELQETLKNFRKLWILCKPYLKTCQPVRNSALLSK
jgi:hypothetical protein